MNQWVLKVHPIAKLLAIIPGLILITQQNTFLAYALSFGMVAILLMLMAVPYRRLFFALIPLTVTLILHFIFYPLFLKKSLVGQSSIVFSIGQLIYRKQALVLALKAGVRILSMYSLSLFFVTTTKPESLSMILLQNLKIPYRYGYVVTAMVKFLQVFRRELAMVILAQKVRGVPPKVFIREFFLKLRRRTVLIFVGAIRRAEQMALSWESRAFGFRPHRTYVISNKIDYLDFVFVLLFWGFVWGLQWIFIDLFAIRQ